MHAYLLTKLVIRLKTAFRQSYADITMYYLFNRPTYHTSISLNKFERRKKGYVKRKLGCFFGSFESMTCLRVVLRTCLFTILVAITATHHHQILLSSFCGGCASGGKRCEWWKTLFSAWQLCLFSHLLSTHLFSPVKIPKNRKPAHTIITWPGGNSIEWLLFSCPSTFQLDFSL